MLSSPDLSYSSSFSARLVPFHWETRPVSLRRQFSSGGTFSFRGFTSGVKKFVSAGFAGPSGCRTRGKATELNRIIAIRLNISQSQAASCFLKQTGRNGMESSLSDPLRPAQDRVRPAVNASFSNPMRKSELTHLHGKLPTAASSHRKPASHVSAWKHEVAERAF